MPGSQNASLILSTNNGNSNTTKTSITWNNINLRTLLGDMYDKYDMFNLCLNTVTTAPSLNSVYKASQDVQVMMRVSGLPFINNTYNVGATNNNNTQYCTIATFTFGNNVIIPSVNFQGSISASGSTLTVNTTGLVLRVGSTISFYDANTSAINTKTITAQSGASTYTLNSAIGATALASIAMTVIPVTAATQNFNDTNIATFGKSQELSNITIDYLRLSDLVQPECSTGNTFPNVTFIFDIYGINKDENNENGTRIKIK